MTIDLTEEEQRLLRTLTVCRSSITIGHGESQEIIIVEANGDVHGTQNDAVAALLQKIVKRAQAEAGERDVDAQLHDLFFRGRGRPIQPYGVKQHDWPELWRMPDEVMEHEDGDKVACFADDIVLRAALNCWDNCGRFPGSEDSVGAGMIGAVGRFLIGLKPDMDIEEASSKFGAVIGGLMKQYQRVAQEGWYGGEEEVT